jgi:arylsulfatase A-like enzyme
MERFTRIVLRSLPVLSAAMLVMVGGLYYRVATAEQRALASHPVAKPDAPNVLLLVLDTVRASCLSLYGHNRPTTPNLERLAKRGVVFTEARATAPWTAPTHASMLTGRWPHELSISPVQPLDSTFPTLAEVLGCEGYSTAGFVGNIFYCNALLGFDRGFDRYEDAYENQAVSPYETLWCSSLARRVIRGLGYSTNLDDGVTLVRKSAAMLNRDLLGWLETRPTDRPFFAFVNYYDAHRPYFPDSDPALRFGMVSLPSAQQAEIDARFQDLMNGRPLPPGSDPRKVSDDGVMLCHDAYDSCIAYLDRQIGLLLDELEHRGQLENTLVIVTSDHGEQLGEHGLVTHGASVYREEVHVPLLVIPPARLTASTPQVVHDPVSLRDIPATVAEWIKIGPRSPFPGRSLAYSSGSDSAQSRNFSPVLCEIEHNVVFPPPTPVPYPFGPARSLVSRDRVYIRRGDGGEELYDRLNDPMELVNLASDPRFSQTLERFREEMGLIYGDRPIITRWVSR